MKTWKIFWGLTLILIAVVLILDAVGVAAPLRSAFGEVSWIKLVLGVLLVSFILASLVKGSFARIFFPLAILFWIFEENIAFYLGADSEDLIDNWIVLLIALLFTVGVSTLQSALQRRTRHTNHAVWGSAGSECAGGSLGSTTVYVDAEVMRPNVIENNLGSCTVWFENTDRYGGGGVLSVENNLGAMTVHVPEGWIVDVHVENNLGALSVPDSDGAEGPRLTVKGENNLGAMTIRYE